MSRQEIKRVSERRGRGTHGSLSKAGKVRDMTRQWGIKPRPDARHRQPTTPRIKNRSKYIERVYNKKFKPLDTLPLPTRQVRRQMYRRDRRRTKG